MGFLVGPGPIRRTLPFLRSGGLVLKDRVKIVEIHYNMYWRKNHPDQIKERGSLMGPEHSGIKDFFFWEVPRIQFQNPKVQMVRFLEQSPIPFLRCWLDDGQDIIFDCDSRTRFQITDQLINTLGLTKTRIPKVNTAESEEKDGYFNEATFGVNRTRFCGCEVPDQVPCPGLVPLPMGMRGKYTKILKDQLEEWEQDLTKEYPTGLEMEKERVAFPVKHTPPLTKVKGLDQVFMRKPKQITRPFADPEVNVKKYDANRFERESDRKLFDEHKYKKT